MLKKNFLLAVALVATQMLFAEWKYPTPARIGSTGNVPGSISKNDKVRVWDQDFSLINNNPSFYSDKNVINRIVLGINRECNGPFVNFPGSSPVTSPYELEVDILIEYMNFSQASSWVSPPNSNPFNGTCTSCARSSFTKTLKIKYDPNYQTNETELSFFEFSGGYDVEVTIQDIRLNGSTINLNPSPDNVFIENIIAIERYEDIDPSSLTAVTLAPGAIANEEVELTITPIAGAENYDIEWTYLDWESGTLQAGNVRRFSFNFKNNASRITVKNITTNIPSIYPMGVILFRVRANGFVLPNTDDLVSTDWSGEESGTIDIDPSTGTITNVSPTFMVFGFFITGFDNDITWQHSVSFAEEGKRKQVISYFDGSLYNRQSITKNNSDNTAIVGQTVYDFNGRPAVQLLPTPVPSTNISDQNLSFKPNFNQTNQTSRAGKTYNYLDFDVDALNCVDSKTSTLKNTSGAEKYYSSNNPFTDAILRDRIPKANGYAFTQTEYMPDNTGRVRRQGGVGEAHRLTGENEVGSQIAGKETKYFYGIPNEIELHRMFANEAGDHKRYKKNIVIDPNGQVSISYLDPMGRVVATSLAGNPSNSANMEPVAGRNAVTTSIDLSQNNAKNFTDLNITSEYYQNVVNNNSTYDFSYRLAIPMLNYQCGATTFCYDCVYNISLSITDECGVELVPLNYRKNKVGINPPVEHECGVDSIVFDDANSFQLTLNQGTYKIKKVVSIDQSSLGNYIDDLLASPDISDCITSYDDLVTQEKAKLDYTNCNYTCEKCTTDAQTLLTAQEITQQEYDDMIDACSIFCNQTTPCDALYQQMIIDMSPGGQYFDNIPQDANYDLKIENNEVEDILPVTNPNDWLTATWTAHTGNTSAKYWISSSGFFGASGTLTTILNQSGVIINTWDDVRKYWIDDFGPELAKLHPEYQVYILCDGIRSSYHYNDKLSNTKTAAEAITNGYYNPTQIAGAPFTNTVEEDPFFVQFPSLKTRTDYGMNQALTNFKVDFDTDKAGPNPPVTYNIWEFVDYLLEEQGSDIQGCLTDYGWAMFRAGYLAEKQKVINIFYSGNAAPTIDPGFKRRFYYDDSHSDDDFENAFKLDPLSIPGPNDDEADYNAFSKQEMDAHCATICNTYVDQWRRELADCNLNAQELDDVIDQLLAVCKGGCDGNNPFGARQVAAGVTSGPRSFNEVIAATGKFNKGICDDLLIQWPKGNYHDFWAELNPTAQSCGCKSSQEAPDPAHNCENCTETLTPEGEFIHTNLELQDQEKCKNCITCAMLAKSLRELDDMYGSLLDDSEPKWQNIIENYLNIKYRFNLTYIEYKEFMAECLGSTTISNTTFEDFNTSYENYVSLTKKKNSIDIFDEAKYAINDSLTKKLVPPSTLSQINKFIYPEEELVGLMPENQNSTTYSALDECGCEKILNAHHAYSQITPQTVTFTQYMNLSSGHCEGDWIDADALYNACLAALESDVTNDDMPPLNPFTSVQKNKIKEEFLNNPLLIIPENCACTEPWTEPIPDVTITECDCYNDALFAYFTALETICNYTFTIDGQTVTKSEYFNFVKEPRLISTTKFDFTLNKLVDHYTYSKCAYADKPQSIDELIPGFPDNSDCHNLNFLDFIRSYNCDATELFGSYDFSSNFCDKCYKKDNTKLTNIKNFFNQIITPDVNGDTYLTKSGWDVSTHASTYISNLYDGTCPTTVTYDIDKWTTTPSVLNFRITDNCSYDKLWGLAFFSPGANNLFSNVEEVLDVIPLQNEKCQNTSTFFLKVRIRVPNSTATFIDYMVASAEDILLLIQDTENCKKLCNKPILPKVEATDPCTEFLDRVAESNAATLYQQQIKDLRQEFTNQYIQKCMSVSDYLIMDYELDEYHYTLYYYDQADNLIKTVPPKGVKLLDEFSIDSAKQYVQDPINKPRIKPNHNYITNYKYNTLNQLVEQTTPDAGTSKFWYDILGRIVLSQNAKQAAYNGTNNEKKFSYTLYDNLGRITEAGEIELPSATAADVNPANAATPSWVETHIEQASTKTQITRTYYDASPPWQTSLSIPNFSPTNLRNRVVVTCYYETNPTNPDDYSHATHYSYDVLGNVYHLVQDFPELEPMGQRYKHIKYNYDLASGNVNLVSYQPGEIDQFYHHYTYDADNRITQVRTARHPAVDEINMAISTPNFIPELGWQTDAKYFYYLHGALARTELGTHKVQGMDYSYTLHGWLKAVNDGFMQNAHDPGLDGHIPSVAGTNPNQDNGRDAIGFELGYYTSNAAYSWQDYDAIGNNGHISTKTGSNYKDATVSLYNGNISNMVTTLADKTQLSTNNAVIASTRGAAYRYDQLNRIKETQNYTNANIANYEWNNNLTPGTIPQEWYSQYSYDAMGNITALKRQDGTGGDMDDLTYYYDGATPSWKNQLLYVDDSKAAGLHTEDIDDQSAGNYTYDEIGNLISDNAEEIQTIAWTVYGKIRSITRTGASTKPNLEFEYNTAGQRVIKRILPNNGDKPTTTFYLRDASGNIMATYKQYIEDIADPDIVEERLVVEEWHLYGSNRLGALSKEELVASRIGVWNGTNFVPGDPPTYTINSAPAANLVFDEQVGFKNYELSNHLGNVLATVTDRKVPSINGSNYDYFNAQITSIADYYPFGMQIEERSWTAPSNKYRFGFNGEECDDEVSGTGNQYDYGFRIYNPRIAKFLSVDPLTKSYPWYTPYQFAGNIPTAAKDIDGLEPYTQLAYDVYWWFTGLQNKVKNGVDKTARATTQSADYNRAEVPKDVQKAKNTIDFMSGANDLVEVHNEIAEITLSAPGMETIGDGAMLGVAIMTGNKFAILAGTIAVVTPGVSNREAKAATAVVEEVVEQSTKKSGKDFLNWGGEFVDDAIRIVDQPSPNALLKSVKDKALAVVEFAQKHNGASRKYYKSKTFRNDGRDGGQVLDKFDSKGNAITYREYDVNPRIDGRKRGSERVVIGSDGRSYYTNDHYKTFIHFDTR